eukprot:gene11691-12904_t
MEFAVELKDTSCIVEIKEILASQPDIKLIDIDFEKKQVLVETKRPSGTVHEILERTGKTVVFRGHGYARGPGHVATAVSHVFGNNVNGLVRFVQIDDDACIIDGTVDGLLEGKHGIHINELGDISNGWQSTGNHFNPTNECHGDRTDTDRHVGDLGNIFSNNQHRATFRIQDNRIKVQDVIGRSLVIDGKEDTFLDEAAEGAAWGIIARSAGLFENTKMVCQCSGQTLWEERRETKEKLSSQL